MVEYSFPDDLEADDMSAFLEDARRCRRHGSRKDSADVSMVSTRGSEEYDFLLFVIEDRTDDGNIWKVTGYTSDWGW